MVTENLIAVLEGREPPARVKNGSRLIDHNPNLAETAMLGETFVNYIPLLAHGVASGMEAVVLFLLWAGIYIIGVCSMIVGMLIAGSSVSSELRSNLAVFLIGLGLIGLYYLIFFVVIGMDALEEAAALTSLVPMKPGTFVRQVMKAGPAVVVAITLIVHVAMRLKGKVEADNPPDDHP